MIKNVIVLIFCLLGFNIKAQIITLLNGESEPISDVHVYGCGLFKLSDKSGKLNIEEFKKCKKISISHSSYQTLELDYNYLRDKSILILESKKNKLNQINVWFNKWKQDSEESAALVSRVGSQQILKSSSQTTAEILEENTNIYVQKSQQGGGSPFINGFAANRILLLVDGVRLNNSIYRSGNLHNINLVDPLFFKQIEIVESIAESNYGSDAIGGLIDFVSQRNVFANSVPKLRSIVNVKFNSANSSYLYGSVNSITNKKFNLNIAFTKSEFGDLMSGHNGNKSYRREYYIDRVNGRDSVIRNSNKYLQKFTSYGTTKFSNKISVKLSQYSNLSLLALVSNVSEMPRYDRLIQTKSDGGLKYAEWNYGKQRLGHYSLVYSNFKKSIFFDKLNTSFSYQNYTESRHTRKTNHQIRNNQHEKLDAVIFNLDFNKNINNIQNIYYGFEFFGNYLNSKSDNYHIVDKLYTDAKSRYPDGSKFLSYASYLQLKRKLSQRMSFSFGLRYNYSKIKANAGEEWYQLPSRNLNLSNAALTANIAMVFKTNKTLHKLQVASALRAPNIDDVAKIFDSEPGNVMVPNPNLKPEYIYSLTYKFNHEINKYIKLNIALIGSYLDNAMKREESQFNGKDSILYQEELSRVYKLKNSDYAKYLSLKFNIQWKYYKESSFSVFFDRQKSEYKDGSSLRHVPPNVIRFINIFKYRRFVLKTVGVYNEELPYRKLAYSERRKPHLYAKDNDLNPYSPCWFVLNQSIQYKLKKTYVKLDINNLFDKLYRPYSSGLNGSGLSFCISLVFKVSE
ncbi:MAG: TonB-dependent receptor [Marinifilaceae bacterium]|jgi:hemoglobin/transferrin/lactoferrin receptor protein|nr:TonB-dependent receptor [Marinifilaceae bacterium]